MIELKVCSANAVSVVAGAYATAAPDGGGSGGDGGGGGDGGDGGGGGGSGDACHSGCARDGDYRCDCTCGCAYRCGCATCAETVLVDTTDMAGMQSYADV